MNIWIKIILVFIGAWLVYYLITAITLGYVAGKVADNPQYNNNSGNTGIGTGQ